MPEIKQKLVENDPSFILLVQIWWSLTWRWVLWFIPFWIAAVIIAIGLGIFMAYMFGFDEDQAKSLGGIIGVIFGGAAGLFSTLKALKGILGLKFSGYQLVLLTPHAAAETEGA